jgi:hypothetical protein
LLATFLTVPTMPLPFWLALLPLEPPLLRVLALLRLEPPLLGVLALLRLEPLLLGVLALLRVCGLRFAVEREALLRARVEAADFGRFALAFGAEPLDVLLLLLLCLLAEADLLVAIRDTSSIETVVSPSFGVPAWGWNNPNVQGIAEA